MKPGRVFFVDQGNPKASDANPGTEEAPWKTLRWGVAQLKAGQTLLVKKGTYTTKSKVWKDGEYGEWIPGWMVPSVVVGNPRGRQAPGIDRETGTEEFPIVVRAYPGHKVTVGSRGAGVTIGTYSASYVVFDGFVLCYASFFIDYGSHIIIQNCEMMYGRNKGKADPSYTNMVELRLVRGAVVRNSEIHGNDFKLNPVGTVGNNRVAVILHWVDDAVIENNLFYHNHISYRNKCGHEGEQGHRNIFRRNIVRDCSIGVHMGGYTGASTDNLIAQNVFVNCGGGAVVDNGGNIRLTVANNTCWKAAGYGHFYPDFGAKSPDGRLFNCLIDGAKCPVGNNSHRTKWPLRFYCDYNSYSNFVSFAQYWKNISWETFKSRVGGNEHCLLNQNPRLVNPPEDLRLAPASPCIDAGRPVTYAVGEGEDTDTITVEYAYSFTDGLGLIDGDVIQIGKGDEAQFARVLKVIDRTHLKLDKKVSWTDGEWVTFPFVGEAPDIGAYEYGDERQVIGPTWKHYPKRDFSKKGKTDS